MKVCGRMVGAGPGALVLAAILGGAALAANPAQNPASEVNAEPASTSATFGDWVLRCQRLGDGAAMRRLCEIVQTVRLPDARDPVAEVALGRVPADKALHLTALLPPNVAFPSTVSVGIDDDKPMGMELQWRRCIPGGCLAEGIAADDLIRNWRLQTGAGRILFRNAAAHDISFPLSFRGFAQALDAMEKD